MNYFYLILGLSVLIMLLSFVDVEKQLHKYDEEMKKQEKKSSED